MNTFSFAQIASAILTSVSSVGGGNTSVNITSQFSLKGKLDLSLWKNIGNEDEEEEEIDIDTNEIDNDKGFIRSKDRVFSLHPLSSPILAPLLPTHKKLEEKDNANKLLPFEHARSHSPGGGVAYNDDNDADKKKVESGRSLIRSSTTGKQDVEQEHSNNEITGCLSNARRSIATTAQGIHQLRQDSIQKPQGLPPILLKLPQTTISSTATAFLSAFVGSSELLRNASQFQSRRERERSPGKKVEFLMESKNTETDPQPSLQKEDKKEKRTGSGKDGSVVRSRSASSGAIARRLSRPQQPTDILSEIRKMSLASQDALEEKKKAAAGDTIGSAPQKGRKFGKKKIKRRKAEEVFTDKDRAAAVTLGSKDIKQSLKQKKKRDRKMRLSINFLSGEEYVIGALLGEASYQMKVKKQPKAALQTLNKALDIQPTHKAALVARSQCYLKLGDAESALNDAKQAWDPSNPNNNYVQGLYQYAEALYQLGEFEKALIAFHRGHRSRKDMDGFRIGIQKCQEAIKRAIGAKSATAIPNLDQVLPLIQELEDVKARMKMDEEEEDEEKKRGKKSEDDTNLLKSIAKYRVGEGSGIRLSGPIESKVKSRLITRELMGQLYLDKKYLKKFIQRPEVINQQGLAKGLRDEASDALQYLESRERFWRQQNPLYSRKNFQTMLKAHAHDVACRDKSVSDETSIAKYLRRRSSVLNGENSDLPLKRQSSENRLGQLKIGGRRKSVDAKRDASMDRNK